MKNQEWNIEDTSADNLITETGVSYRDKVSVIDKKGKRIWVFANKPFWGFFQKSRTIVGYLIIAIFVGLPFIKFQGQPYFLIDIVHRHFIFFGTVWFPHDFYIFAIGLLSFVIFIVLFTAVFGRIFCGWACPQTIFLELLYRKVEYLIEGDAPKQRSLKNAPMSATKFIKKFSKHTIFIIFAFIINFFVFTYFMSVDGMIDMIFINPGDHIGGFMAYIGLSLAFFGNYAWFREQACSFVCPYGRLQSVLIDKNSIIVAYDNNRGEPRGKLKGGSVQEGNGDCIDCGACVRVCPTGIDIRNGLQLECVNCTNCIDSCNEIMGKINKPKNLISYTSIINMEKGKKFTLTPRLILYSILLTALLSVFVFLIATRADVEATILRAKGTTFVLSQNGDIVNVYTVKLINKTFKKLPIKFKTEDHKGKFTYIGTKEMILNPEGFLEGTFLLEIPKEEIKEPKNKIKIGIYSGDRLIDVVKTNFSGPFGFDDDDDDDEGHENEHDDIEKDKKDKENEKN